MAEIAPPHPSTQTHDTNDTPVKLNVGTLSPISNTLPSPLSRRLLLMDVAKDTRAGVPEREKREEDVRVNVCISVPSTLTYPPVMLNGEVVKVSMGVDEMVIFDAQYRFTHTHHIC